MSIILLLLHLLYPSTVMWIMDGASLTLIVLYAVYCWPLPEFSIVANEIGINFPFLLAYAPMMVREQPPAAISRVFLGQLAGHCAMRESRVSEM